MTQKDIIIPLEELSYGELTDDERRVTDTA